MITSRNAASSVASQLHTLCKLPIFLHDIPEGENVAILSRLWFKNGETDSLTFSVDTRVLEDFIQKHGALIRAPGNDGSLFAECCNRYVYNGETISNYKIGLTTNSVHGFLDALHFVALEGRLGQFPWAKFVLPPCTYCKLEALPFKQMHNKAAPKPELT